MPYIEIPGFMSRAQAQREYKRSKSSFIRDVDDAFKRDDAEFLDHFRVLLNDGSVIEGSRATKEAVREVQSKQPRWHVAVAFLETRYWDQFGEAAEEGIRSSGADRQPSTPDSTGAIALQHRLELAQQQISTQGETIDRLENDKEFLQNELKNRRGEIDKLRGFFESVGDAADSTARLRGGESTDRTKVIPSSPKPSGATHGPTAIQRHLPTFYGFIAHLRSR